MEGNGLLPPFQLKHRYVIAVLIIASLLVYAIGMSAPSLFGDDWWNLKLAVDGAMKCPGWLDLRPLHRCWPLLLYNLFGVNVVAFHVATYVITLLLALILYFVFDGLLPGWPLLNLIIATLFLVYPSDFTHSWLSGGIVKFAFLPFLLGCLLFAKFWRGRSWRFWASGLVLFALSLAVYEAQLGLMVAGSIGLFALSGNQKPRRRLALLAPTVLAGLFAVWRIAVSPTVTANGGYGLELISLNPTVVISRLILGYRINLQWAWTEALVYFLPYLRADNEHTQFYASILVIGFPVLFALLARCAFQLAGWKNQDRVSGYLVRQVTTIKHLIILCLIGLVIIGVGYIPTLMLFPTGFDYIRSRYNSLSSIGAAVSLGAVIGILAIGTQSDKRRGWIVLTVVALLFIALGGATQIEAQQEAITAWKHQKAIWQMLFRLAPNLRNNTTVFVYIQPQPGNPWTPAPMMDGEWGLGATSAVDLFYKNDTLHGLFLEIDPYQLETKDAGVQRPWGVVPYNDILLLEYNYRSSQLNLLTAVPSQLLAHNLESIRLEPNEILPGRMGGSKWRLLVQ